MKHRTLALKILLLLFLNSCTTFQDAGKVLRNEKTKTTDEFLIEKKEPLTTPPDLFELPEPKKRQKTIQDKQKLEKILKTEDKVISSNENSGSTEQSILRNIKK